MPVKKTKKSKRILLVDTSTARGEYASRLERDLSAHVDIVRNGDEALATLRQGEYHLLIMEFLAPGKNGAEVCAALHQDDRLRTLPVILISLLPLSSERFQHSLRSHPHFGTVRGVLERPFRSEYLVKEAELLFAIT